jgi:hypothetical protein
MLLLGVMDGAVALERRSLGRWRDDEVWEPAESLREYIVMAAVVTCVVVGWLDYSIGMGRYGWLIERRPR